MGYSIRRWMSASEMLFDDSKKAKTAEEAIMAAEKLAGICKQLINDDIKKQIRELPEGESIRIKRPSLGFTMRIKRTRR